MKHITKGELYVIRDALQEQDEEDVTEAMAIVEALLHQEEVLVDD